MSGEGGNGDRVFKREGIPKDKASKQIKHQANKPKSKIKTSKGVHFLKAQWGVGGGGEGFV